MAVSARVRQDVDAEAHGDYFIKRVGSGFRVYEDASGYSSTSGGFIALGKVLRDDEGKPVTLPTLEAARSWIDKGCLIYPEVIY
jgi:hypothetical protein